jgi:hypothetical protein
MDVCMSVHAMDRGRGEERGYFRLVIMYVYAIYVVWVAGLGADSSISLHTHTHTPFLFLTIRAGVGRARPRADSSISPFYIPIFLCLVRQDSVLRGYNGTVFAYGQTGCVPLASFFTHV